MIYNIIIYSILILILGYLLYLLTRIKKKYHKCEEKYIYYKNGYEEFVPPQSLICAKNSAYTTYVQNMRAVEKYARILNSRIPRNNELLTKYFSDFFIFDKPKENDISGDFFFIIEHDKSLIFGVIDSPGYNIDGLMSHLYMKTFIQKSLLKENGVIEASRILNRMDEELGNLFKDIPEYAICFDCALCCLEKDTNRITFSGGYLPLYHVRNEKLTKIDFIKKSVGNFRIDSKFKAEEILIQEGDFIYLATDGFENQFGGIDKRQYKYKYRDALNIARIDGKNSFDELVLDLSKLEKTEQTFTLKRELDNWKNQEDEQFDQVDDILIVGLKI